MPRGPRNGEVASKRMVVMVTLQEDAEFFALARHLKVPLAVLVRKLLAQERRRIERSGVRVPRR